MDKLSEEIRQQLFAMQDTEYRDFNSKLIPNVEPECQIGIRTPRLRKYAKELGRRPLEELVGFLGDLPHFYFEENNLHGFLLEGMKDYGICMEHLNAFLPYINNWATCDTTAPKILGKHKEELLGEIAGWLASDHAYTVRYGIGMLMRHFLDEDFRAEYLELVASIRWKDSSSGNTYRIKNVPEGEYYVNMMIAWYFATALAKQWEAALPYIEEERLPQWCHNKTIQKAVESYRISSEKKEYLRTLRRK